MITCRKCGESFHGNLDASQALKDYNSHVCLERSSLDLNYCPICKSKLYPEDKEPMEKFGHCSYCVCYPHKK
jgi:hypothetical protein